MRDAQIVCRTALIRPVFPSAGGAGRGPRRSRGALAMAGMLCSEDAADRGEDSG